MFRIVRRILFFLVVSHFIYLILLIWINPPITLTQIGSVLQGYGLKRDYVGRDQISSHAKLAVMASEDQLFPDHDGFDFNSIKKAMAYNEKKPGRVRGASTISQQVAKNVFLWQGRSWIRKGLEVYFTFMIELFWSKKRILDMYLNITEMGKGIFGIEAAAQAYFKKPAKNLTRSEAAMIAACLPNPKVYSVKPPSRYVSVRSRWILWQMSHLDSDAEVRQILWP
jgi:monofunctional biosynthetic peptidoglycan transglycosylase